MDIRISVPLAWPRQLRFHVRNQTGMHRLVTNPGCIRRGGPRSSDHLVFCQLYKPRASGAWGEQYSASRIAAAYVGVAISHGPNEKTKTWGWLSTPSRRSNTHHFPNPYTLQSPLPKSLLRLSFPLVQWRG